MSQTDTSEHVPFPRTDGVPSAVAAEAFTALGNETRLSILLALWESPIGAVLSFSDLHDRVEMRDSGQFNYHLDRLLGGFVRKVDGGYQLRNVGAGVIEAVIAGTWFEQPTLDPVEIDFACPFCGAPTAVGYAEELLYLVCTECEGSWRDPDSNAVEDDAVDARGFGGRLFATPFDPAGLENRTPRELFVAATAKAMLELVQSMNGICPTCSGRREPRLSVCEDHSPGPDRVCPACRHRRAILPLFECSTCETTTNPGPSTVVWFHPAVIEFYREHGVTVGDVTDPASLTRYLSLVGSHDAAIVSQDPPLVRVTIRHDDDALSLTYDETISVVDVER